MMSAELRRAFGAATLPPGGRLERGGVIRRLDGEIRFEEVANLSDAANRYVALVPPDIAKELIGFWHTHRGNALPGYTDLRQFVRLNRRFGRPVAVCIAGGSSRAILSVGPFGLPRLCFVRPVNSRDV